MNENHDSGSATSSSAGPRSAGGRLAGLATGNRSGRPRRVSRHGGSSTRSDGTCSRTPGRGRSTWPRDPAYHGREAAGKPEAVAAVARPGYKGRPRATDRASRHLTANRDTHGFSRAQDDCSKSVRDGTRLAGRGRPEDPHPPVRGRRAGSPRSTSTAGVRCGFPEVIFGQGKTPEQIEGILRVDAPPRAGGAGHPGRRRRPPRTCHGPSPRASTTRSAGPSGSATRTTRARSSAGSWS